MSDHHLPSEQIKIDDEIYFMLVLVFTSQFKKMQWLASGSLC